MQYEDEDEENIDDRVERDALYFTATIKGLKANQFFEKKEEIGRYSEIELIKGIFKTSHLGTYQIKMSTI